MIHVATLTGCTELEKFNISNNKVTPKVGPELKKFLQSCGRLNTLRMKNTGVPVQVARDVIKAIIANKYLADFSLDLSSNKFGPSDIPLLYFPSYSSFLLHHRLNECDAGVLGANMIAGIASEITSIRSLDLNDNEFGDEGMLILAEGADSMILALLQQRLLIFSPCSVLLFLSEHPGLRQNPSLRELHLGDNWTRNKTKQRSQAIDNLIGTTISADAIHQCGMTMGSFGRFFLA